MAKNISGIQQVGVGVPDFKEGWNWYIQNFNMNIRVFEEKAIAKIMLPYTEGEPRERHACLALNMNGGGGFEVWQHTGKKPVMPKQPVLLGDFGICVAKLKTHDINALYQSFKSKGLDLLSEVTQNPAGENHFFVKDLYGNFFEFVESNHVFQRKNPNGGIYGVVIGVKNIEESIGLYQNVLGYDEVVFDRTGQFEDFQNVPGGNEEMRRVLLKHSKARKGAFSQLLGPTQIELVEIKSREAKDIFQGRMWGDPGFIHLCFDIQGMSDLREECKNAGFPFTVDSSDSFDMGEAAGHFSYIQAPEGTLIEFVETHKVPVLKKYGLYINLQKRNPEKSLPKFMLKAMGMNKVESV